MRTPPLNPQRAGLPGGRLTQLLLALVLLNAWPQAPWAATLGEVYEMARSSDPQFAAARAAALAGREKAVQGRAGLMPNVSLGGTLRSTHEVGGLTGEPVRDYTTHNWNLSASLPVLRRANVEAWRQGELQALLADQQLRLAEQDLLLRVARAYFDVLQAHEVLASTGAQRSAFAQQLTQARRAFEVGMAPVTDVNEAQARSDLAVAQEIAAGNDIALKRSVLEKSIARAVPPLAGLDQQSAVVLYDAAQLQAWLAQAPESALPVAVAVTAEQVARREVARQQAGHLPTVDLVLSHNDNAASRFVSPGNSRQTAVGFEVSIPLYQGGGIDSRVREAVANLERAGQDLANARAQARLDANQAHLGVLSGQALHQALRQAQASGEVQVRSTQRGFEVGTRTRSDVLNATQQLFATRKDLAAARYQTLVAGLQLKAAAGLLSEADLIGMDRLLTAAPR